MNHSYTNCKAILSDFPPPLEPMSSASKSVYCLFIVIFSFITLSGNTMVITAVARFRGLQKRTNAFIVSLACADIGVIIFVMPFRFYLGWNGSWELGKWTCIIFNALDAIFCMASINTLYCVAFERYLAVCRPFLHMTIQNTTTVFCIGLCWLIAMLTWSILPLSKWHVIGIEDLLECLFASDDCPYILNVPTNLAISIGTFWIPSAFMLICYWRIFVTAKNHGKAIQNTTIILDEHDRDRNFNKTLKAARTLAIVVGCFFLCWMPFFIFLILDAIYEHRISPDLKMIVLWSGYINSMLNPFLYYRFNQTFKIAFKSLIRCERHSHSGVSQYRPKRNGNKRIVTQKTKI